ncbi:MAG: hypothetical protein EOO20_17580 [Chryseobacterium sp.]|nr:MAG: hypothetical protein EOO20_17580 [Chryseobacterium sp.]
MKWVKVLTPFHVALSGVDYTEGQEVEVSDQLAKRHGEGGTGFLKEIEEPAAAVKTAKLAKKVKVAKDAIIEPEKVEDPNVTPTQLEN